MLQAALAEDAAAIQTCLDAQITGDLPLHAAMRHALFGGKALRGFLVMETARLHDVNPSRIWRVLHQVLAPIQSRVFYYLSCLTVYFISKYGGHLCIPWPQPAPL